MSDPTPPATPTGPADDRPAPWGHSRAAHRAFDVCSHCRSYSVEEEVIQWRTREKRRHEAEQAALAASAANSAPLLDLASTSGRPCPGCGAADLTVVSVTLVDGTRRPVGGWAYCGSCDATPHPTMDTPDSDGGELPYFLDSTIRQERCPSCRNEGETRLVSTFTVTTRSASHVIGVWSYCIACEAAESSAAAFGEAHGG